MEVASFVIQMRTLERSVSSLAHAVAACAFAVLAGCTDATAPRESGFEFQYSGAESGVFHASGTPGLSSATVLARGSFASAIPDANDTFKAISNDTSGAPFGNMFNMYGIPARPGTYSIPISASTATGAGLVFHLGVQWTPSLFSSNRLYILKSGSVTVSEYGPLRVRGSFQGTAVRFTTVQGEAPREITITGGSFDLSLSDVAAAQVRCVLFSC